MQKPDSQHQGARPAGTRTGPWGVCRGGQGLSLAERENSGTAEEVDEMAASGLFHSVLSVLLVVVQLLLLKGKLALMTLGLRPQTPCRVINLASLCLGCRGLAELSLSGR